MSSRETLAVSLRERALNNLSKLGAAPDQLREALSSDDPGAVLAVLQDIQIGHVGTLTALEYMNVATDLSDSDLPPGEVYSLAVSRLIDAVKLRYGASGRRLADKGLQDVHIAVLVGLLDYLETHPLFGGEDADEAV